MGKMTRASSDWKKKISSLNDVKRLWSSVRSVPGRTQGCEHYHEERYCLGLYLVALGTHGMLGYPFQVEQGRQHESPDFMVTWASGEVTGLEVTRATTQSLQRKMTDAEREQRRREAAAARSGRNSEQVSVSLPQEGGLEAVAELYSLVRQAIEAKLAKLPRFRPASRYDLLIYDDAPLLGVDRRKLVVALNAWVRGLDVSTFKLGTVSVIISLDVLFDLGGAPRVLPYIRLDEPSDLPERIEYAGRHAAERALREHAEGRKSVYSMDNGTLVKQTSDGQRFEVRVDEDGTEVVVGRLSQG